MKVIASHKNNMESIQANKEGKRESLSNLSEKDTRLSFVCVMDIAE